jgi:nuclear pore complex protein Nup188
MAVKSLGLEGGREGTSRLTSPVDMLRNKLDLLGKPSGLTGDLNEELEVTWNKTIALEIVHLLQIVFDLVDSSSRLTASSVLVSWFRLMADYEFFEKLELVSRNRPNRKSPLTSFD